MILTVPQDKTYYPTLGPQICEWVEENLVFGPGDLRGQPYVFDDEKRALVYRMYEVYPKNHPLAGRRRFKRCGISIRKGLAKTELAAIIAACELHPDAPVRCVGWTKKGEPIGGPVSDPYVVLVAYTEEQSDELAYGALKAILEIVDPQERIFDIGLERIARKKGGGKAVSLSSSPNARDGARTTFSVCDETHWWTLPRLKQAHQTMQANLPKRRMADAWMLEITTAYAPGEGSVAEGTMDYARAVANGTIQDSTLFFFHRQAGDDHDLTTKEGARAAVIEASGPAAAWSDIDSIVALWADPTTDRAYWERVWCNRIVQSAKQAFDVQRWDQLQRPNPVKPGDWIVVGFDGAIRHDSTGMVGTHIRTGYQWVLGVWERPQHAGDNWVVPAEEVDARVREIFDTYRVFGFYADPPYWRDWISRWAGDFGDDNPWGQPRVVEWWTNQRRQMTHALENFDAAIKEGHLSHDGDDRMRRHLGNARRSELKQRDEDTGKFYWLIRKERPDSPHKIDLAMAAVLSWEARRQAIAAGCTGEEVSVLDTMSEDELARLAWS